MADEDASVTRQKRKRDTADDLRDGSVGAGDTLFVSDDEGKTAAAVSDGGIEADLVDGTDADDDGYDERHERKPLCAAYDEEFEQAGQILNELAHQATETIQGAHCSTERAQKCLSSAEAVSTSPKTSKEKIALFGRTGTGKCELSEKSQELPNVTIGKSSLLNSLLGIPNMAKAVSSHFPPSQNLLTFEQMDIGQSCTYVCTQYESAFPNQETPFAAKIEYLNATAIRKCLSEYLESYNEYHFNLPEDINLEEKEALKEQADTALKTFRLLFCDKIEMASPTLAKAYLDRACHEPLDVAVSPFLGWCEDLLSDTLADTRDGRIEFREAFSQESLMEKLQAFTTEDPNFREPSKWPLVKSIRVGILGPPILNYATFVDLPGVDDTNQIRVNAAHDAMRSCKSIWIVASIGRVITDKDVERMLSRYGTSYDIAVVCTKSDLGLDGIGLADELRRQGQSVSGHDELADEESQQKALALGYKKSLQKLKERKSKARYGGVKSANGSVALRKIDEDILTRQEHLDEAEAKAAEAAKQKFELLLSARNGFTRRKMQDEKQQHLEPGKRLEFFCVSNTHYAALKGGREVDGPRLDPRMTGIPALREYVLERAAPGILHSMEYFVNYQFSIFMEGLALLNANHRIKDSPGLLASVRAPQAEIDGVLEHYKRSLSHACDSFVVKPLTKESNTLGKAASTVMDKKKSWHWSTMRAYVRRDGCHSTSVMPLHSWNLEFMESASWTIREQWQAFKCRQEQLRGELQKDLVNLVDRIESSVDSKRNFARNGIRANLDFPEHPARFALPMQSLMRMFEAQRAGIKQACEDQQEAQEQELR